MTEPRLFFLGRQSRELPAGWRGLEADPEWGVEVIPGVRVACTGTGDFLLPDGGVAHGAGVAVWDEREPPAAVEWGIVRPEGGSGSEDVRRLGDVGEAYARQLLRQHRSIHGDGAGWLVTRETGQWKKVQDGEG